MGNFTIPGAICNELAQESELAGKLCRKVGITQGPILEGEPPEPKKEVTQEDIQKAKARYLNYARATSYAMWTKSRGESGVNLIEEFFYDKDEHGGEDLKQEPVQNHLGGKFLRMYLDHKVDKETVKEAGEYIAESPRF
jgi:hypothetical protein